VQGFSVHLSQMMWLLRMGWFACFSLVLR